MVCHGMLAQMVHCLICKQGTEHVTHLLLDCPFFKQGDSVWLNIKARITERNPLDSAQITDCNFISNLDEVLQLLGGLSLPLDNVTATFIKRLMSSAVGKIYKVHRNKSCGLEAPWVKRIRKKHFSFCLINKFCNLGLLFSFSNFIFLAGKTSDV